MILQKKLKTKQSREELIPAEPVEIVEEVVTSAGDWKTCKMCNRVWRATFSSTKLVSLCTFLKESTKLTAMLSSLV